MKAFSFFLFFISSVLIFPQPKEEEMNTTPSIYLNQTGYLAQSEKFFLIDADKVHPSERFQIVNYNSNSVEFEGIIASPILDDQTLSGKILYRGDFSGFQEEGTFSIVTGGLNSSPFRISVSLYQNLSSDCLHSISLVRANVAIHDQQTGLVVNAGHLGDFDIGGKDYSGGWYNAGDYGKWTHCSAINIANLLWLYELHADLPEETKEKLLAEARWGMEWLLKMQDRSGAVYHKVDTEPDFAWGQGPDADTLERTVKWTHLGGETPSSIDAGDFIGAASLFSRLFRSIDPEFSLLCQEAAEKSWEWLLQNPDNPQTDPYYTDSSSREEFFWAAAEIFCLNEDPRAGEYLQTQIRPIMNPPLWMTPDFYGSLALIQGGSDIDLRRKELELLEYSANIYIAESQKHPFRHTNPSFWWSSNVYVSGSGQLLAAAWYFTGKEDYRKAALDQLHYLLGRNALNRSFVAGYGSHSMEHPYHWAYYVYGITLPGWIAGGANGLPDGADPLLKELQAKNTPPALCYLDVCSHNGSWASNEGTLAMVSSLMFLSGMF